ncbi:MAG: ABC-type transport system, ATP-binding component, partial [Microgenomates group bacterium GW2011_GWF2_45_18]
ALPYHHLLSKKSGLFRSIHINNVRSAPVLERCLCMHVLKVDQLTKTFPQKKGRFTAVDSISFALGEGEILGLLGPNGAGKTTTIQMLLGTLTSTQGSITYFDKNFFKHRSEIMQKVSFASAYINFPHRLTIQENLDVYARLYGLNTKTRKERIQKFLTFFEMWKMRSKTISSLSAGQKTRVMLAKAFLAHPQVVLLDEPTASLDPDIAEEVLTFIRQQQKDYNVSILFTSHNMAEVAKVCDRVLFLQKGKIVANDTPEHLAKSVSIARVELMVGDGLKRTQAVAEELKCETEVSDRSITIAIDERKISDLLITLAKRGVEYSQISIQTPTLEDYFIQKSKEQKKDRV